MSTSVRSPSDTGVPAPAPDRHTRANASEREIMNSPKRLARIAGLLYLFVGIFGGFAEGFVDPKMYVAGDSAATAGNVFANAGVVRLGVVAHLLDGAFIAQVFFGLWLAPLGYLAYKSEWFPKWLGVVLILASVCYL